jgi:hypothetical protein
MDYYSLPTSERKTWTHEIIRFFHSFVNKHKKVTIEPTNKTKCHNNNHPTIPLEYTGVSEIRVLILTSGRTRQIMELFSITFLRKSNTN